MDKIVFLEGKISDNKVITTQTPAEIASIVSGGKIGIIKGLFSPELIYSLKKELEQWADSVPPATADDFKGNYHSKKAKISNLQQVPHVFHDFNFNDFTILPEGLRQKLFDLFEPLRNFYNELTGYNVDFGYIQDQPYLHPQLIQYPVGGGFFGRHNHNLLPQKIGFILSLSKYGTDYEAGGTCFAIDNEIVDIEKHHDIGDLCIWPYEVDHWVKQSPLHDQFTWDFNKGRWVATLAYFNPY